MRDGELLHDSRAAMMRVVLKEINFERALLYLGECRIRRRRCIATVSVALEVTHCHKELSHVGSLSQAANF